MKRWVALLLAGLLAVPQGMIYAEELSDGDYGWQEEMVPEFSPTETEELPESSIAESELDDGVYWEQQEKDIFMEESENAELDEVGAGIVALKNFEIYGLKNHYLVHPIERVIFTRYKVDVVYGDGTVKTLDKNFYSMEYHPINGNGNYLGGLDEDRNILALEVKDSSGKDADPSYLIASCPDVGKYTAKLKCGNVVSNSYSFEVGKKYTHLDWIKDNQPVSLIVGNASFQYKPTKSGKIKLDGYDYSIGDQMLVYHVLPDKFDYIGQVFYDESVNVIAGEEYILYTVVARRPRTITLDVEEIPLVKPVISGVYNSVNGADIRWKAVPGAAGYIVYRKRGGEGTKKVAAINSGNTTQCYDPGVKDNCWGRVYNYYVVPINGSKTGPKSDDALLQRLAPMKITSIKNTKQGASELKWVCTTKENKAHGYEVQYAESRQDLSDRDGTFMSVKVNGRNNLSKTITGLTRGKTFYFRIRCYVNYTNSKTGKTTKTWSQYSNVVSVKSTK